MTFLNINDPTKRDKMVDDFLKNTTINSAKRSQF